MSRFPTMSNIDIFVKKIKVLDFSLSLSYFGKRDYVRKSSFFCAELRKTNLAKAATGFFLSKEYLECDEPNNLRRSSRLIVRPVNMQAFKQEC